MMEDFAAIRHDRLRLACRNVASGRKLLGTYAGGEDVGFHVGEAMEELAGVQDRLRRVAMILAVAIEDAGMILENG